MNKIWGITALNHDASIAVIDGNEILFAAHAERYSRIKNDNQLNSALIAEAMSYGTPAEIVWFERPLLKKSRQFYAGQYSEVRSELPAAHLSLHGLGNVDVSYVSHHRSHAAAGYYTSTYTDAAVVVADAIGEWDCISIWHGKDDKLTKKKSVKYPHSIGLLYSAFTDRIGLKANEEEYILMGMAAYGKPKYVGEIKNSFIQSMQGTSFKLLVNVHRGIRWWRPDLITEQDNMDIAASIQQITEEYMCNLVAEAKSITGSSNLVLMGGVALNCVANEQIAGIFNNIWIMPNPGDSGSAIGAVAAKHNLRLKWDTPYLGTSIDRPVMYDEIHNSLLQGEIIGFANGRAEFGPRALGNRSLLADPRGPNIKAKMNSIKKRQQFRPFAPIILEEFAHDYFELPVATSPYMQFTATCKQPDLFPAICHTDNTSRVQTVNQGQNPVIYAILRRFYDATGCPMLVNTSLNIKGEPLVNTWGDAIAFTKLHNIKVF
jgi:carbamoyltransferase